MSEPQRLGWFLKRVRHDTEWWEPYQLPTSKWPLPLVEVVALRLTDGTYRVCVWGQGENGMQRDFEADSGSPHGFAMLSFYEVSQWSEITREALRRHSFVETTAESRPSWPISCLGET